MIHQKYDHIKVKGKYYQCVVADKTEAVFALLVKKKDCLSAQYKHMFVVSNTTTSDGNFQYEKARLTRWDGKSIKKIAPIKNAVKPSFINENRTLTVYTKSGLIRFKVGQYINYHNNIISKP